MFMIRLPFFLATGLRRFTKSGYERAAKEFKQDDTETDLQGKTVMITGANQGIGFAAAKELAGKGCTLFMVCRDAERGKAAVESVRASSGNPDVHLSLCDISSIADIRRLVAEYEASGRPLHALINNAGLMVGSGCKSVDGYEMNFAANTLGTYAITRAFEDILKRSSPSRVLFVASGGALTQPLEANDLEGSELTPGKKFGEEQYARDKRRQLVITEVLAAEWAGHGVAVYSMHPGWVDTSALRTSMPDFYERFKDNLRTIEQGADTIVWLTLRDPKHLVSGEFYCDRAIETKHLPMSCTAHSPKSVTLLMEKLNSMIRK
jgi:dehydrogenase/reductase SDR family protein 12